MDKLIKELEQYKIEHCFTYTELARQLQIPENYLFRWRKKGRITGIYKKIIENFLRVNKKIQGDYRYLKHLSLKKE